MSRLIEETKRGANQDQLTSQQRLFVETLIQDPGFSPENAARIAGYKSPSVKGSQLLRKPHIRAHLGKFLYERRKAAQANANRILEELTYCALRDPIGLVDEDGNFHTNLHDIPEELRRAIDGLDVEQQLDEEGNVTSTRLKIKFVSKVATLDLVMRHLGMLDDRGNSTGNEDRLNWDHLLEKRKLEEKPSNVIDI